MSHAILTMADNNFLTQTLNYQKRVTVHWILQTFALILITVAQTCIFLNKQNLGKSHYQSTHSLFGLTTYLLTLLSTMGGVSTKYSFQLKNLMKPLITKIMHSFSGLITYILAVVTICLGINQFGNANYDSAVKPIIYCLLFITTLYITIKSFILLTSRASNVMKRSNL
jgi:protein-S-isoprenylcysteine O-methyltransferase Ste14